MKTILLSVFQKQSLLILLVLLVFSVTHVYANRNIKFSVDMSLMVSQGNFNPSTDAIYIKGTFNSWGATNQMVNGSGNVYSATLSLADNSYYEFKYFITTTGAANGGWENNFPVANSGNRPVSIGIIDLTLPTVYYNDGDMDQFKSTTHFNFYYTSQENTIIEDYSTKLEENFERITAALQSAVGEKISIYIYKNLAIFHLADGYPEMAEWATGTAWGKKAITVLSPTQVGYDGAVDVLIHEFTHVVEAWKTKIILPAWLNEGVACYYGRNAPESYEGQTNFRAYIKTLITQSGKPMIETVFNGNEGYTWSTSMAYFIAMTKGEVALAKFVENMNYADLGYSNLTALQLAWWSFLDDFVNTQNKTTVKFSVDMAEMIKYGYFVPGTNHVYVCGGFNSWGTTQLTLESGTVYSASVPMSQFYFVEYKFYVDNSSAPNGGWESDFNTNFGYSSNRLFSVANTELTLATQNFNFPVPEIDLSKLQLRSPTKPGIILARDTTDISWELTDVTNINIEFSDDNGAHWQTIGNNISTSARSMKWVVSNTASEQCKIRIADVTNASNNDESDNTFRIVKPNIVGGPYLFDKNTVALFHFDNDLNNRSNQTQNALGDAQYIGSNSTLPSDLGNCISTTAPIMVPYSEALNLSGDWTIEAWVKFTSFNSSNHMYLFYKPGDTDPYQSNYSLEVNPWWGNVFYGFYFSAFDSRIGVTSVSPSLNQWYHVAFIRDTKQSAIYVIVHDQNRHLVASSDYPYSGSETYLNSQNLQIGTGITGYIDEVRISNVVRSFINTGIDEVKEGKEFSIYPNPSNGIVHISGVKDLSKSQIRITDITGKRVEPDSSPELNTIDLQHLRKGVYFIQLTDAEGTRTEKVVLR